MAVTLSEAELLKLVDVLADGEWHSGEDLAALADITRAALSKRMEKLRDWQLDIETRTGLGYRLAAPRQLTALPLAVGVACARALREVGFDGAGLKWPNDLHVSGRKLGGILIEHRAEAGGPCRVIIGIGINVAMTGAQAQAVNQPWIGLHEALASAGKPTIARQVFALALSRHLTQSVKVFEQSGFDAFAAEWVALDLTRDREIIVQGPQGSYQAIARGVDEHGALVVEALGQLQTIHSGEVSLRLA